MFLRRDLRLKPPLKITAKSDMMADCCRDGTDDPHCEITQVHFMRCIGVDNAGRLGAIDESTSCCSEE